MFLDICYVAEERRGMRITTSSSDLAWGSSCMKARGRRSRDQPKARHGHRPGRHLNLVNCHCRYVSVLQVTRECCTRVSLHHNLFRPFLSPKDALPGASEAGWLSRPLQQGASWEACCPAVTVLRIPQHRALSWKEAEMCTWRTGKLQGRSAEARDQRGPGSRSVGPRNKQTPRVQDKGFETPSRAIAAIIVRS